MKNHFRSLSVLALVSCLGSGCAYYLNPDASVSGSLWVGGTWPQKNAYTEEPRVSKEDFLPAGPVPFAEHTSNPWLMEASFAAQLRFYLPNHLYLGVESNLASFYEYRSTACGNINCQQLRATEVDWWNRVLAEEVVLKRYPSFGFMLGFIANEWLMSNVIEYSFSVRRYELDLNSFYGVDCMNCPNGSGLKESRKLMGGAAFRHAIEIGCEEVRVSFWFERYTANGWTGGVGLHLTAPVHQKQEKENAP